MTLKEARQALGLTQVELDRRAKLPKNTTQDIEIGRNRNPSWTVVSHLVHALRESGMPGLKAEDVFGGVEVSR